MNFYQLLVFFAIAIAIIVSAIVLFTKNVAHEKKLEELLDFKIYQAIFVVLFILSVYYSLIGERTSLWFATFSLYFILSLLYSNSKKRSHRTFTVFSIIILALISSSMPVIQNQGVTIGPDQLRDIYITSYILEKGTFEEAIGAGYYSFLPLFNVINAVLVEVTGWDPMMAFAVMQAVYSLVAILSIFLIAERLAGNTMASLIAVAVFLSTPRLTTVQVIPAVASICLGTLLVLFILEENMNLIYIVPILSFTVTVFHPMGVIPVLFIELGIILIGYLYPQRKIPQITESYLWAIFTITAIITLVYWSIDEVILTGVVNPLRKLLNIFSALEYSSSIYTPQYLGAEFQLFSYAWAFPVAISAVYVIKFFIYERKSVSSNKDLLKNFAISASVISLSMLTVSFVSTIINPGASLERYMSVPAYTLMIFPTALIFHEIIKNKSSNAIIISLILLTVNIYIGQSSPNWAPFENPTFGAVISTYTGYNEAQDIIPTIPKEMRVYVDNDIPVLGVSRLYDINVIRDSSYQTIRVVVEALKDNNADWDNPRIKNSITYLKIMDIRDKGLYREKLDIVYSNGIHFGISLSRLPDNIP